MEILSYMLPTLPLFILSVTIEYRFSVRLLQRRFSAIITFLILFGSEFSAGYLNYYFRIAGTTEGNALYNGFVFFVLCCLLFHGEMAKKIFVSMFVTCGIPTLYYVSLPFITYFFAENAHGMVFLFSITKYINSFLCLIWMEYMGKKFQNLRNKTPQTYTIYLSVVILFVYVAVYAQYGRIAGVYLNSRLPFFNALLSSFFAVLGIFIVWYAVFELDKQVNNSVLEQMKNMQLENLHSREAQWEMLSSFRHDINNHLICLNNMLAGEKHKEALGYIANLTDAIKQLSIPVQTGNEYTDALLGVKYAEALKYDIDISIDMNVPKDGVMEPVDICCILGNALDVAGIIGLS